MAADNGKLEEAIRQLTLAQAALVQANAQLALSQVKSADEMNEIRKDFGAIMGVLSEQGRTLAEHTRILAEHSAILERLPDAIRDRLGFQPKGS